MTRLSTLILPAFAAAALFAAGCDSNSDSSGGASGVNTGGGNVGGSDVGGFQLTSISVPDQAIWKINRQITFVFSAPVQFSSVNLNTISIRDENGLPANGVFSQDPTEPRVITFQPTCPVQADFSDAGLLPGGRRYRIQVLGDGSGGNVVTSTAGRPLAAPQQRDFFTPSSVELSTLFEDSIPGAPLPVIRSEGSGSLAATFIEVAEDSTVVNRIYFERDAMQAISVPGSGDGSIPTGHPLEALETGMPLNLYSDQSSRLGFFIEMNQPVNPRPENISSDRIMLQAEQTLMAADFAVIPATVELVRNCTTTGATVLLRPEGVLPQNVRLRLVVAAEFEDLAGVRHLAPIDNFGFIQTRDVGASLAADEILEDFVDGAAVSGSFEDDQAAFPEPRAIWDNGSLSPRFDFDGSGGPSGAFDFTVRANTTVVIDTTFATIQDKNQTLTQTVINGRMDVRDFIVEPGGVLQFRGPNIMTINATGDVQIDGLVELNGFAGKDVAGVNTASFPEPGAAGNLGGGRGGDASVETDQSTFRGGDGAGAFGIPGLGGRGGETGFGADPAVNNQESVNADPDFRKGAGGGGGVLGPNPIYSPFMNKPSGISNNGLAAISGANGHPTATGAIFGGQPQGGVVGTSPFQDESDTNDFFGVMFNSMTQEVIRGELGRVIAGAGGGGAGDSTRSAVFPTPNFTNKSEDKGGAGGGGAGGLHLRSLGNVTFGAQGQITANGGAGARGQLIQFKNNFFTKAGGGGGGGSGGHIVIETAKTIDLGSGLEVIAARGGAGGPGANPEATGSNAARGGPGGPGLIQLHTPNGVTDISHVEEIQLAVAPIPEPYLSYRLSPAGVDFIDTMGNGAFPPDMDIPNQLVPSFGPISRARSKWIPLGGAVGALPDDVVFLFGGTDPTSGRVLDTEAPAMMGDPPGDGVVDDLTQVIGPAALAATGFPTMTGDNTLVFDNMDAATMFGAGDAVYRENPLLMKNFVLLVRDAMDPASFRRYNIESVTVDPMTPTVMRVTTSSDELPFSEFLPVPGLPVTTPAPSLGSITDAEFLILPRFFKVVTSGIENGLPTTAGIRIRFEGTGRAPDGGPQTDPMQILVPFTSDIDDLFDPMTLTEPIHFFRFEVEFNIDELGAGLSASNPRPTLEFLRVPFRF